VCRRAGASDVERRRALVEGLCIERPEARGIHWVRQRSALTAGERAELNPDLDIATLSSGEEVCVWTREPGAIAHGVGRPDRGRLRNGEPLPAGEKYHILFQHRAFGTYHTVSEIVRVMEAYAQAYPGAERVIVGDLSYPDGKRIRPHLSHQTGRDVDITYPRDGEPRNYERFHPIRLRHLDVERTFFMIHTFIAGGMVEYIFIDRPIQKLLYEEAKRHGATDEWLEHVFQYPRYSGTRALIRRAKGHDDHMHIRFICQPSDRRCD